MNRFLIIATCSAALFSMSACETMKPVGFLDAVDKTMAGEPLLTDEPMPEGKPNMHDEPEERSSGFLQWKVN